jgi:hypothetical protein
MKVNLRRKSPSGDSTVDFSCASTILATNLASLDRPKKEETGRGGSGEPGAPPVRNPGLGLPPLDN